MAIMAIEKLPEKPTSTYKAAQAQAIEDVLQIIRERITLCEITMDAYSGNYIRSAIHYAIRRACWHWNKDNPENRIDFYTQFDVTSRKDKDGNRHWYIKYKPKDSERRDGDA